MRMIKEDEDEVLLNISLDELRGSDTEIKDTGVCGQNPTVSKRMARILIGLIVCVCGSRQPRC